MFDIKIVQEETFVDDGHNKWLDCMDGLTQEQKQKVVHDKENLRIFGPCLGKRDIKNVFRFMLSTMNQKNGMAGQRYLEDWLFVSEEELKKCRWISFKLKNGTNKDELKVNPSCVDLPFCIEGPMMTKTKQKLENFNKSCKKDMKQDEDVFNVLLLGGEEIFHKKESPKSKKKKSKKNQKGRNQRVGV